MGKCPEKWASVQKNRQALTPLAVPFLGGNAPLEIMSTMVLTREFPDKKKAMVCSKQDSAFWHASCFSMPDVSLGAAPPAAVVRLHSPPCYAAWGSTSRRVRVLPPCPHCDQPDVSLLRLVLIGEIL